MSARRTLPIGIIVMILMMALAALGVGYAWWTEQLTATGSIQTGNIDVHLEGATNTEDDPLDATVCTPSITEDGKSISINVNNAYPAYSCTVEFKLVNHGSVPAKITKVKMDSPQGAEISALGTLASGSELKPSEPLSAKLRIEVKNGADQRTDYSFSATIDIAQGNAPEK